MTIWYFLLGFAVVPILWAGAVKDAPRRAFPDKPRQRAATILETVVAEQPPITQKPRTASFGSSIGYTKRSLPKFSTRDGKGYRNPLGGSHPTNPLG